MKRILSLILVVIMLASVLSSCNNTQNIPDAVQTDSGEITPEVTQTPVEPIALIASSGEYAYDVDLNDKAPLDYKDEYKDFLMLLEERTGVHIAEDDKENVDTASTDKPKIYFGGSTSAESKDVYASIGFDGYAVRYVNGSIVVAAYTLDGLKKASESFFNDCTVVKTAEDGSKELYYVKDVTYEGTQGLFFTAENPLNDYKIVYSANYATLAKTIANCVRIYSGIKLEIVTDDAPVSEKEIIIGNTKREESKVLDDVDISFYEIRAVGKKLVIRTGLDDYSSKVCEPLLNTYLYTSPSLNFPAETAESKFRYYPAEAAELTEGADVRVMSFNILNQAWMTTNPETESRVAGVMGCIDHYSPDVVGLQEVDSDNWYKYFDQYLSDEYVFVNDDYKGIPHMNYTVLAYNKNKVNYIEGDLLVFSSGTRTLRLVNIGVFEHKVTGKRFIVTSTHISVGSESEKMVHSIEFSKKINEVVEKYNLPILCTGDYNGRENTAHFREIISRTSLLSTKVMAETKGLMYDTHHGMNKMPNFSETSIDHILYKGNVTIKYYTCPADSYVVHSSDHTPLFTDFKFN